MHLIVNDRSLRGSKVTHQMPVTPKIQKIQISLEATAPRAFEPNILFRHRCQCLQNRFYHYQRNAQASLTPTDRESSGLISLVHKDKVID